MLLKSGLDARRMVTAGIRRDRTVFFNSIHLVHELMEELKPVFAAKEDLLDKKDLLARVQMRLQNYIMLRGSELEDP